MRVVLAEDQFLLRDGLAGLLASHGIDVVAAVTQGPDIIPSITQYRPDLALLDIRLPPTFPDEGLRAASKDRVFDDVEFVGALRTVQQGGTVMDPEVVKALIKRQRVDSLLDRLTGREHEVLQLMAQSDCRSTIRPPAQWAFRHSRSLTADCRNR